MRFDQPGDLRGRNPYKLNSLWYNPGTNKKHSGNNDLCFYIMWYKATYILPSKVTCEAGGRYEADQGRYRGTSLIRNSTTLGTYCRTMPRVMWLPQKGGRFLLSEAALYLPCPVQGRAG